MILNNTVLYLQSSSSEYASVTQGSLENGPSYSSGSQYART